MPERTLAALLATYPDDVQLLARNTRKLLRELLPSAKERVDSSGPYVFYGYGTGYNGVVCNMMLSKKGVKLGIADGADLDDPSGLLEGAGKRHRHIVLKQPSDLRKAGIRPLIRSALRAWRAKQTA
jgi:hypothetical protein